MSEDNQQLPSRTQWQNGG